MSSLFDRLLRQFDASHHLGGEGLQNDLAYVPPELRPAAVLVAVTERSEPGVLLTHRPETMTSHPGQVAFPGGKLEFGESPIEAALREANEELGIDPSAVRIIGEATTFPTGSGYELTPVLGMVSPEIPITPDPYEVSDWFEAPLRHLFDPANHVRKIGLFRGIERPYTEIQWEGHRIWGITAGIIANLSRRLAWQDLVDE